MINVGEVAMISIHKIEIGPRAREEMGDLESLEDNMKQSGLISPLAVRKNADKDKPYLLLAGERRYGILFKNKVEQIPVRIYPSDITEIEIRSIELAENFHRKDFEWHEHDNLVRDIHSLQQEIHGEKISTLADASGWGMKDTGKLVGKEKGTISTAIKRAEAREAFPELFDKCKTQSDASKVLKKLDEEIVKDVLVQKIAAQKIDTDKKTLMDSYVLKDFFEFVQEVPDEYFHLVEIDPPYAINIDGSKKGSSAKKDYAYGETYNEISAENYSEFLYQTLKVCYAKMTEHSWLIFWFAPEPWFEIVYQEILTAGFECRRMCGIWTKGTGQSKRPEIHLANSYEMFFYAWKGRPALARPGSSNEFNHKPVPSQYKTHPTERPVELTNDIYSTFAWPGSRILIPFLGSGNGLLSAKELGMTAIGTDLTKSYRDSFLIKVYKM